MAGRDNVIIGMHSGGRDMAASECVLIGPSLPAPNHDGVIRIGSGEIYLEIDARGARIAGTENVPEAVREVLSGIEHASDVIFEHLRARLLP